VPLAARPKGLVSLPPTRPNEADVTSGARPIVDAWRTQYGAEMTAVLAYNDPSALGVVAGRGGDFQPLVTGMNGDSEAVGEIEAGRMLATMGFPSVETGNAAAVLAHDLLVEGKKVPHNIIAEYEFISADNIDQYVTFEERLETPMEVTFEEKNGRVLLRAKPESG
jgi:ABC-type sugar transport system substrate-binding protein